VEYKYKHKTINETREQSFTLHLPSVTCQESRLHGLYKITTFQRTT